MVHLFKFIQRILTQVKTFKFAKEKLMNKNYKKILSSNQIVKNYKEMCAILNDPISEGNSKKSQLKEWQRYFDFGKQGQKFIINEIYPTPLPKSPNKNAIFVNRIELLLMHELAFKRDYTCNYKKVNLFLLLGMINPNYIKDRDKQLLDNISNEIKDIVRKYPYWQVKHFCNRVNQKLSEILFSALNSMEKRGLLTYKKQVVICEKNTIRIATTDEEEAVLKAQATVLNEMGITKIPFVNSEKFYENVNAKLFNELGWQYVYNDFKIVYNQEFMKSNIEIVEIETRAELVKQKLQLNCEIINTINRQAQYLYEKNLDNYDAAVEIAIDNWDGYCSSCSQPVVFIDKANFFRYPSDYIDTQAELANLLLNIQ